jgi:hypothetical protein
MSNVARGASMEANTRDFQVSLEDVMVNDDDEKGGSGGPQPAMRCGGCGGCRCGGCRCGGCRCGGCRCGGCHGCGGCQ